MPSLIKSFIITAAALCLLLGLTIAAPLLLAGVCDGGWKTFRNP